MNTKASKHLCMSLLKDTGLQYSLGLIQGTRESDLTMIEIVALSKITGCSHSSVYPCHYTSPNLKFSYFIKPIEKRHGTSILELLENLCRSLTSRRYP